MEIENLIFTNKRAVGGREKNIKFLVVYMLSTYIHSFVKGQPVAINIFLLFVSFFHSTHILPFTLFFSATCSHTHTDLIFVFLYVVCIKPISVLNTQSCLSRSFIACTYLHIISWKSEIEIEFFCFHVSNVNCIADKKKHVLKFVLYSVYLLVYSFPLLIARVVVLN